MSVHHPLVPSWLEQPHDANELSPTVWPAGAQRSSTGELTLAGVTCTEIIAEHASPVYVVDEQDARSRARTFRTVFESEFARVGATVSLYYAAKAFLCTAVAHWMKEEGLRIDVCSAGELAVARAAGVAAAQLGYHGNNKSLIEIEEAVALGVGALVIDSESEISRVAEAAARHKKVQSVRLRVNSGVHAHTHDFLATAHEDQKFGVSLEDAPRLVAAIRAEPSLHFLGLHGHIGSQIFGTDGFAAAAARLLSVHAELLKTGPVPEINLGGGFGIAYTSADQPTPAAELASQLADILAEHAARLGIPLPHCAFEPGRAIIGPSTATLYTVGTVKDVAIGDGAEKTVRRYLSVDGGMSDNARPALYGADYSVRLANRCSSSPPVLVRVVGKHCETGDILVYADYLPGDVVPGDILAIPATGAYCFSLASNYNYLPRPAVLAVREGKHRVIVRGESRAELLARDPGIPAVDQTFSAYQENHD